MLLARRYGVPEGEEIRIGLQLAQEDLAQLLGASRQRVNQETQGASSARARCASSRRAWWCCSKDKLLAIAER